MSIYGKILSTVISKTEHCVQISGTAYIFNEWQIQTWISRVELGYLQSSRSIQRMNKV